MASAPTKFRLSLNIPKRLLGLERAEAENGAHPGVILVIFMICACIFESLLHPLAIISLIPVSFIAIVLVMPVVFPLDGRRRRILG